jgi:hypothetical protein
MKRQSTFGGIKIFRLINIPVFLYFYPISVVIKLILLDNLAKIYGYTLFHPATKYGKSPINPEDPVYKYKNINESIPYLNNYSCISKGGSTG